MSTSSTISGNQRPQAELLGSPDYSSTAPPARSTGGGVEQMSTAPAAQTDLEKHYCEACSAAGLVPRDWVCAVLASVPASLWSTADSADLVGGNIPTGAILQLKPPMPGDALQPEELSVLLSMLTRYEFLRILLLELSGNQVDREACENVVYLIGMSFATYTPANIRLADCGFTSGGFNLLRLSSKQYHLQRLDLCHNREWRTGNKEHWRALLENKDEQLRLLCVQYTGLTNADLCTMLRAIAEHLELRDSQSFHLKLGPPAVNSTAAEHFSDASMQELLALVQKLCGLRVLEALDIWGLTEAQRHLLEQHWAGVEGRAPTVVLGQGNLAHFTTQSGRSDCEVWPTEHVLPDAPPTPPQPASSTSSMHRPGSGADHPAACDVMDGGVRLDRVGQRDAQPIPYHPDPAAALRRQAQENQFAASNAGGVDSAVRKRVQQTVATKASAGYFRPNSVLHLVGPAPYQHQLTSPGLHQRHSQPDQPARRRRRPANQSGGGHHQEGLPRAQPDVPEERGDVDMQAYKGQKYRAGSQGRPHGPGDASHRPTLLSSHRLGTGIGDREIGISTADPDDDWQSPPPEDVRQRRKLQGKRKQPSRDPAPVMPGASLGATPPGAPSSEEEERSMHVRSLTPSGSGSESGPGLSNAQSNSAEAGFMVSSQVAPDELQYGKEAEIEKQLAAERGGASSTEEDDEDGPANLVAFPRCLMADKFPAKGPFAAPLHNKRTRVSKEVQMLQAFAYDPNRHKYPPNLDKMHLGVTEGRRARRCPQRYSPEAPGHNHDVEQVPMAEAVGSLCAGFSKVLQAGIASPPSQARAAACPPAGSSAALAMDVEEFELVIPDSQEQDDL
ncbi:hypothetical protein WJX72_004240 [[Myrmecia] bisecta]|uniref:Uncharacterized protein n=1 Tax=[Myrmecia] bisecta TaxID=41462 RepID=A0AAW1R685_9CHLO